MSKRLSISDIDFHEQLIQTLKSHETFSIECHASKKEVLSTVKSCLGDAKLRYRTYTSKRTPAAAAMAASGVAGWLAAPSVISAAGISSAMAGTATAITAAGVFATAAPLIGIVGIVGGVGVLAHRVSTANPDYEITEYIAASEIKLTYKR